MSTTTTYPFTTAGNYTASDSDLIEVTGGVATLIDLREANEVLASTFTSSLNANRSTGSGTATTFGSVTLSGGAARLVGDVSLSYPAASNFSITQSTVRFSITPQYSGGPATYQNLFNYIKGTGNASRIIVQHATSTNLEIIVYNSSTTLVGYSAVPWTPTSGVEYEFEIGIDVTNADIYVFINGTLHSSITNMVSWTVAAISTEVLTWGRITTLAQNYYLNWVNVFSGVKHTSGYTAIGTPAETPYDMTSPTVLTNSSIIGNINSFTTVENVTGGDLAKYTIQVGGTDKYWTGSVWATSTGYAQSNTASDINSNIAMLDTGNSAVKIKTYLYSADGTTTPTVDTITITYDASDSSATEPTFCYLEGWLYDFNGPVSGQIIEVRPFSGFTNSEIFLSHDWQTFDTTASDGYFSGRIWESASVSGYWEFRIGHKRYKVQVPNSTSAKWSDLTITAVTSS